MDATLFVQVALASTSFAIALILGVAWHEFGQPRHAAIWSIGFLLTALMAALGLAAAAVPGLPQANVPIFAIAGFAAALNTLGFRQRAGAAERRGGLLVLAGSHALAQAVIGWLDGGLLPALSLLSLLNVVLFWQAAGTLRGRRKGERSVERVAEAGLLLLCAVSLALLIALACLAGGVIAMSLEQVVDTALLILPGVIVAIGLFTIVLLAADLADRARRLAATDILTGILNRRGFEDAAAGVIARSHRDARPLTIVLADIDRFKAVNDRFGHPAGDRILRQVCACIGKAVGRRDLVARIGGEEFALALPDCDIATAARRVEDLRRAVAALPLDLPEPYAVTASFGLASLHRDDQDLATPLRRADAALYRSKADGRNRLSLA
jgi:diguanylate cyclase (GGDEF)-like protein